MFVPVNGMPRAWRARGQGWAPAILGGWACPLWDTALGIEASPSGAAPSQKHLLSLVRARGDLAVPVSGSMALGSWDQARQWEGQVLTPEGSHPATVGPLTTVLIAA